MRKKLELIILGTILTYCGIAIMYYAIIGGGYLGGVWDYIFGISQLIIGISQLIIGNKTGNENWNEID